MRLQQINNIDPWIQEIIKDDPVRPEIPIDHRINEDAEIYALWNETELGSVTCICYTEGIPGSVEEMYSLCSPFMDTVVFYTIWSYTKGSGRELILQASDYIKSQFPSIKNVVTLSPKTEMARKFHISNGAWVYRDNPDTINYAYHLDESKIRK